MKKIIFIIFIALFILVDICFATVSTTTVDKNDIPVANWFYMPIGRRAADIQNDLIIKDRSGDDTTTFPGDYTYQGTTYHGWYVNTDFNTKYTYTGGCYDIDPPTCEDYHPGEDWNGDGGGDTDEGQPVYAIGAGIVIGKGVGWGNMVLIVHRLPNDELIICVYAHLQNATSLSLGNEVTAMTQIGNVGQTGTTDAHLHWEIRKENMLDISGDDVTISSTYHSTYWPGSNTSFIASHYYDPTDFIKSHHNNVPMYNYTFPNNSSEGWAEGNNVAFMSGGDTDSMYMNITGTNPGFISPAFCPTVYNANCPNVYADEVVIQFRAKVIGRSSSPTEPVTVYVKDQNDSWANSLTLETVSDSDYHYYVAYLSDITNASTKLVQQFSIELTEGSTSGNEYWEFDLKNNKFI